MRVLKSPILSPSGIQRSSGTQWPPLYPMGMGQLPVSPWGREHFLSYLKWNAASCHRSPWICMWYLAGTEPTRPMSDFQVGRRHRIQWHKLLLSLLPPGPDPLLGTPSPTQSCPPSTLKSLITSQQCYLPPASSTIYFLLLLCGIFMMLRPRAITIGPKVPQGTLMAVAWAARHPPVLPRYKIKVLELNPMFVSL